MGVRLFLNFWASPAQWGWGLAVRWTRGGRVAGAGGGGGGAGGGFDLAGGEAFEQVGEAGHGDFDVAPGLGLLAPLRRAGQNPGEQRGEPQREGAESPCHCDGAQDGGGCGIAHWGNIAGCAEIVNYKNSMLVKIFASPAPPVEAEHPNGTKVFCFFFSKKKRFPPPRVDRLTPRPPGAGLPATASAKHGRMGGDDDPIVPADCRSRGI